MPTNRKLAHQEEDNSTPAFQSFYAQRALFCFVFNVGGILKCECSSAVWSGTFHSSNHPHPRSPYPTQMPPDHDAVQTAKESVSSLTYCYSTCTKLCTRDARQTSWLLIYIKYMLSLSLREQSNAVLRLA